jgi:hypothetical protein
MNTAVAAHTWPNDVWQPHNGLCLGCKTGMVCVGGNLPERVWATGFQSAVIAGCSEYLSVLSAAPGASFVSGLEGCLC